MENSMENKKTRGPNTAYKNDDFPWDVRGIFSARVRYWMQELHLSEKQIAERSRGLLTDATVSNCIHNQTEPRLRTIAGWMAALGCSADALIDLPDWVEQRKKIQENPGYTGLSLKVQKLLHKHSRRTEEEVKTGDRSLRNGVNVLNGLLEENGDTILDALWTYICCADHAKKIIRNYQRKFREQISTGDDMTVTALDTARKDLEAAESRLMRLLTSALESTAKSEELINELEKLYAAARITSKGDEEGKR